MSSHLTKRQDQREHWDRLARTMPDLFSASSTQYYRQCEIAMLQRTIGSLRGKRVLKLDLWNEAVNTRILNWMYAQGAETFGIDFSGVTAARAARNARADNEKLHLAQADIRQLPFPPNTFDFVYTVGTIEHIDEYAQAVGEIRRVLKPGGRAIIGVPHKWNIFLRPLLVWILDWFDKYPYSPEKSFGAGELRRVVQRNGLSVKQRTGILCIPGIIRIADIFLFKRENRLHRLTPIFLWPFAFLERRWSWPGYFGYLVAVVAEKMEP